jgi:hypothetical protein
MCHGHESCGCQCGCHCCHQHAHAGGCCQDSGFQRRYQTKAEQIAELEAYLAELKAEVQAVEERLADLRR